MAIDHRLVGPGSTELPQLDYLVAERAPVPNYSLQDMRSQAIDTNIKSKQLEAAQAEADRVNMLRAKLAGLTGEEGFDWKQASNLLASSGDVEAGMDIRKMLSGETTQGIEDEGKKLKNAFDVLTVAGQMAERVQDQSGLENLKAWTAQNVSPGAAQWLPQAYSPETMKKVQAASYAYRDKIADQIELRSQDVRARGHDLTAEAARKRQALGWAQLAQRKAEHDWDQIKPRTPLVQIGGEEKEEDKQFGKLHVERYGTILEDADVAEQALMQIEMARNVENIQGGPLAPFKAAAIAVARDLGVPVESLGLENVANAAAYTGIIQNLVLSKMQAQKGPQTENDAKRIERTVATLGTPEEARVFLLDVAEALELRKVDKAEFFTAWKADKGYLKGAQKAWRTYLSKTPLVAKNKKTGIPILFPVFKRHFKHANPGVTDQEINQFWQEKYGRSN